MRFKIQTWHFFVFFFVLLVIWIRWDNAKEGQKEEQNKKLYDGLMEVLSKQISLDSACILWREAYNIAGDYNKKRWCLGNIVLCEEQKGKFIEALNLLKEYEEEFEVSSPTIIHKAILYSKMGEQQKAKTILDSIISTKKNLEEPSFWENAEDMLLLNNKKAHINEAYMRFFNEYICKIVALSYRVSLESDNLKRLECMHGFEKLNQIDQHIKDYSDFINTYKESISYFLNERIRILQITHMYLSTSYWEPENTIDDILRFKWTFIQMYLDEYDKYYGYNKTKLHFQKILKNNGLASEGFQKFLVNAYMNIYSQNNKYNLNYNDFKKLRRGTFGWLVKLTPTTILKKKSAFINAGITKPCLLLSCNEWNLCDSMLFTRDVVLRDKGRVKTITILKNDYTTDTLHIKEDLLGVKIEYRPASSMTIDLLRRSFFTNE